MNGRLLSLAAILLTFALQAQVAFHTFEEALHLTAQLLQKRFCGLSFRKLLTGCQQFLKDL